MRILYRTRLRIMIKIFVFLGYYNRRTNGNEFTENIDLISSTENEREIAREGCGLGDRYPLFMLKALSVLARNFVKTSMFASIYIII